MWSPSDLSALPKTEFYRELAQQLHALVDHESDPIANMANCAALIFHSIPDLNWAGFYLLRGNELVVGPFQGQPACVRIALGRGVCGTAAAQQKILRVADVDLFPGHIACDAASRSELVVPLLRETKLLGVLDLDSPLAARFEMEDEIGIAALGAIMAGRLSAVG